MFEKLLMLCIIVNTISIIIFKMFIVTVIIL